MLRSGVVAILGPNDPKVAAHVQSMSDVFRIPHIENRFELYLRENFLFTLERHLKILEFVF